MDNQPIEELSQEVIDFYKETVKLQFPFLRNEHPSTITARVQDEQLIVEVWSETGKWLMSSTQSVGHARETGEVFRRHPEYRERSLEFLTKAAQEQPHSSTKEMFKSFWKRLLQR